MSFQFDYTSRLDELFDGLPKRLGVQEVAELLDMTTQGVYKWIHSGTIPAYKLGATWIILRDELRDAIASGSNLTQQLPASLQAEKEPEEDAD
jgi:excisionase family DNA binding protein